MTCDIYKFTWCSTTFSGLGGGSVSAVAVKGTYFTEQGLIGPKSGPGKLVTPRTTALQSEARRLASTHRASESNQHIQCAAIKRPQ